MPFIAETFLDLLTSLANQNLHIAMGQVKIEQYLGFLSVFHDIGNNNSMTFSALTEVPRNKNHESIREVAPSYSTSSEKLHILDDNGEDIPAKLQSYAEAIATKTYNEEQSVFMKHTLILASELCHRKEVSRALMKSSHTSMKG